MKRITTIVALAALALFATAAAATASVTVDANGVGHVDKGDVQTALKWNNHDFDKYAAGLTFSSGTVTKVYNNSWICQDGSTYNQPRTQVLAQLKATPVKSSNGKQITGWDLTGVDSTKVLSDTGVPAVCPGSHIDILASYFSPSGLAVNTPASTTVTPGFLQVTGNGVTADLPNTPVDVPTV
jgi:hypothetical protein